MAPKKKEHSGDIRSLVIEHFLNGDGDSYAMIAKKSANSKSNCSVHHKKI